MRSQDCKKGILAMVKWQNLPRSMAKSAQLMADSKAMVALTYFLPLWARKGIFYSMNQQKLYLLLVPTGYGGVASMIF